MFTLFLWEKTPREQEWRKRENSIECHCGWDRGPHGNGIHPGHRAELTDVISELTPQAGRKLV